MSLGQPGLHSEFLDSLGYVLSPCLNNNNSDKSRNLCPLLLNGRTHEKAYPSVPFLFLAVNLFEKGTHTAMCVPRLGVCVLGLGSLTTAFSYPWWALRVCLQAAAGEQRSLYTLSQTLAILQGGLPPSKELQGRHGELGDRGQQGHPAQPRG